jgi:hypothetical protein
VSAPVAGEAASNDASPDRGHGERSLSNPDPKPDSSEAPKLEVPGAPVVARLDEHTTVEVMVRPEGVEVLLDTTAAEVARFDGLEEELRSALRQGDADLLNYTTRDGSEEPTKRDPSSKGHGSASKAESTSDSSAAPVARGSLINVVA